MIASAAAVDAAVVVGAAESPYERHPAASRTTTAVLVDAVLRALREARLAPGDVDGLAVASFTLAPDHAIDLAWRLGMSLTWLMQDTNGGGSGTNMLAHAVAAIERGEASVVVLAAGDRMEAARLAALNDEYNRATRDLLAPLPFDGPNTLFAFLTQRHMERFGLTRRDYGRVAIAQRAWAADNPGAAYRAPLTLADYLAAPPVAPPLHRYDCVPPVTGADALVLVAADRAATRAGVRVRAVAQRFNDDHQEGDGLATGLRVCAPVAWERAGLGPGDVEVAAVYDDYPAMVLIQLADLGLLDEADVAGWLRARLGRDRWPLNTSGGMLSAGQAGAAGGLHGLVEVATQLLGRAGPRQVPGARIGIAAGYGMVVYRWGACSGVAVLERDG